MYRPRIREKSFPSSVETSSRKRRSGPKKAEEELKNVLEIETSGERLEKNVKVKKKG